MKLSAVRKIVVRTILLAAIISIALFVYRAIAPFFTSLESAELEASRLVDSVGGAATLCDEARALFSRYEPTSRNPLRPSDLNDFPAIAALGGRHYVIERGEPRELSVTVGSIQRDGFLIRIFDTENLGNRFDPSNSMTIRDSCTLVIHR